MSRQRPLATYRGVLRSSEFRLLWLAEAQSLLGDQLARVALSVLVYDRTRSGFATAAVYALTFLPAILGNVVLGAAGDRIPRRRLLVGVDVMRAALVGLMALSIVNLPVMTALLVVVVLLGSPWAAAQAALIVDLLPGDDYPVGVGLRTGTLQAAQLIGFGVGGAAVAAFGARTALAIDAASFLVSAVVIRIGVRSRPAATPQKGEPFLNWRRGVVTVWQNRQVRLLLPFTWLLGLLVVPEALAAPYAAHLGTGPRAVGLLLAAGPSGVLVGSIVYARWAPVRLRAALVGPLAIAAGVPLMACALVSGLPATAALWFLSGACTAYEVQVVTEFVASIDDRVRARALGLASAGLLAAQGIGLLLGGALAQITSVSTAVAVAGAAATACAVVLALRRHHARGPRRSGSHRSDVSASTTPTTPAPEPVPLAENIPAPASSPTGQ